MGLASKTAAETVCQDCHRTDDEISVVTNLSWSSY